MRFGVLFVVLMLFSANAAATDIQFEDIFPACGMEQGNQDVLRCGADFLVPNFHLTMILNLFVKMVAALFMVDELYKFLGDPVQYIQVAASGLFDVLRAAFFPDPAKDEGVIAVVWKLVKSVMNYFYGIVAPVFVILVVMLFEFVKTYLEISVPLLLWLTVVRMFGLNVGANNPGVAVAVAVFSVALMFFGTMFLLSYDAGLFSYLVRW